MKDVKLILGTDYTKTTDGAVTRLKYPPYTRHDPFYGTFTETDTYDFLEGICHAQHSYIPLKYEEEFITDLNERYGKGDHLWRNVEIIIAIKEHAENFELMEWTSHYEEYLNR